MHRNYDVITFTLKYLYFKVLSIIIKTATMFIKTCLLKTRKKFYNEKGIRKLEMRY